MIGRLMRGVWSLAWAGLLLVGIPVALVHYIGWPLPDHWPTRPDLERWVAQPLTRPAVIGAFAVGVWLLWAILLYAVVVEILTRARRAVGWLRGARLPPLPTPMQATASGMLGAAVFGMSTGTAQPPVDGMPVQPVAARPATPTVAGSALPAAAAGSAAAHVRTPGPPPGRQPGPPPGPQLGPPVDRDTPTGVTSGVQDTASGPTVGIALPDGGWVTDQTAAATVSMVTVVWVQRRRRYVPRRPGGAVRDDADLTPLPDSVAAVQAGLRRREYPDDEPGDESRTATAAPPAPPDPSATAAGAGAVDAGVVTIGYRGGRGLRPADLPAGGVGLTGDGAAAAVRGIVAAVLLPARPTHYRTSPGGHASDADADQNMRDLRDVRDLRVVTTVGDLAMLLGPTIAAHHGTPGLAVADSIDDAIGYLDDAVLHRSPHPTAAAHDAPPLAGRDPAGSAESSESAGARGAWGPLLLVASCPTDPAAARRLAAMLRLADPLGITGVLLGRWPHGPCWRVDPDGVSHPDPPTDAGEAAEATCRLSVLTADATADLLTLLREARPDGGRPPATGGPGPVTRPPCDDSAGRPGCPSGPAAAVTGQGDRPPAAGRRHPLTSARPLRLTVLGAPGLHYAGGVADVANAAAGLTVVRFKRSAGLQVLVFLAVHPTGATAAELGAALWSGVRPDTAAGSVYTAVRAVRATLPTGLHLITRDGDRYRLDERHVDVDLWRLHEAVDNAATALDPGQRRAELQTVVHRYTGELAAGQPWPWLAGHREAVRRHVVDAHAALAATEPDPHTALAILRDAIRVDPVNEELHRRAMRGYAAAGNPSAVRQLLARLTERLAEADLQPDQATHRLGSQLAATRNASGEAGWEAAGDEPARA
jgi:DNA-binding SARP family transcriptional activator